MKVKAAARSEIEKEALEKFVIPEGILIDAEMPPDPPELIPGILLTYGATAIIGMKESGKGEPLDAKVLTPTGWKLMGDLKIGDRLTSPDGLPSEVIAIHPKGKQQVYRVTFSDGRSAETDGDHLWEVFHPNWDDAPVSSFCYACGQKEPPQDRKPRVVSTDYLRAAAPSIKSLAHIYGAEDLEFGGQEHLPISPWLLGVLLGDGCLVGNTVQFTTVDQEIVDGVKKSIPVGLAVKKLKNKIVYSITLDSHKGNPKNPILEVLRSYGLIGKRAWEKSIPEEYLWANRENRTRLLAGLVDTDGYVSKKGDLTVCTTSQIMAEQIQWLARSLGCVSSIASKEPYYFNGEGKKIRCKTAYNIHIAHSNPRQFATLTRKVDRLQPKRRKPWLKFSSIEPSRITETRCITVSHPGGLYITDDFIVTHNSLIALEIAHSLITGEKLWGAIKPNKTVNKVCHFLAEHASPVLQGLYKRTGLSNTGKLRIFGPEHLGPMKLLVSNGTRREEAVSFYKRLAEGSGLVVFDPLAAFIQGQSSENDNVPMRSLIDAMIEISTSTGAACLVLGHQGKPQFFQGKQMKRSSYATRGASSTEDALTAVHYLDRESGVTIDGCPVYELKPVHFKGTKAASFHLLRDPKSCRHTLR